MAKETDNPNAVITTPFGHLGIWMDDDGLTRLGLLDKDLETSLANESVTQAVTDRLRRYLRDPLFPLDIDIDEHGTPFQKKVWARLRKIPVGETICYGDLARELKTSARAIGGACRRNPIPIITPCHRVTSRKGLGGYMGQVAGPSVEMKKWLIRHEHRA